MPRDRRKAIRDLDRKIEGYRQAHPDNESLWSVYEALIGVVHELREHQKDQEWEA